MSKQAFGWVVFAVAVVAVGPFGVVGRGRAEAQPHEDYARLEAYGAFGFGGDGSARADAPIVGSVRTTGGLDPTIGFGVRHTSPVGDYFAISGLFEALTMQWDTNGAERKWVLDFSVMPQFRVLFELGSVFLEPYVGVPIGFTLGILENLDDSHSPHGDEPWPGFNAGAMAGVRLITDTRFGAFVEAGWRHHQAWSHYSVLNTDYEANVTHNQFALNAGVVWLY